MKPDIIEAIGKYAGLAGFALGLVLLVFSRVIRARLETVIPKSKIFQFYALVLVLTWSLGLAGMATWALVGAGPNVTKDGGADCTTTTGDTAVTGSGNTTIVGGGCASINIKKGQ
jgi:hypothetical protein